MLIPKYTTRRPSGLVIVTGPGGVQERDTLACVHCQAHWIVRPGSGRTRGWCLKCGGPTCGAPGCDACVPFEKKLELMESRLVIVGV